MQQSTFSEGDMRPLNLRLKGRSLLWPLSSIASAIRFAYSFDGVDDRGQLAFRAINIDGDNTFEFWTPTQVSASDQQIIAQNVMSGGAASEFRITYINNGTSVHSLGITYGGTATTIATNAHGLKAGTKYGLSLIGTTATLYEGGLEGTFVRSVQFVRGAVREPTANTMIMTRAAGTTTSYVQYAGGLQSDIKINGILWPVSEKGQSIQLPSPSGLGANLITPALLETPSNKGAQWTYLGDGRWQLVGDGTYNEIIFFGGSQPNGYVLDFEIESISGGTLRCFSSSPQLGEMTNHIFSTVGKHRFVLSKAVAGSYQSFVRHGGAVNCVIKNISLRPLYTTAPAQLVTNWDFSAGTAGWSVQNAVSLTESAGRATLTTIAGQNSRLERGVPVVAGKHYEVSMDVISLTPTHSVRLNVIRGVAGNYAGVAGEANSTALGRRSLIFLAPAADALVQVVCGNATEGTVVVDNVSVREITSLCNPLTLVNTNPDRWQDASYLPAFSFNDPRNTQFLPLL